jgi:hypothetical protein
MGFATVHGQTDNEWKFLKEDDGIKVYTRHRGDMPLKSVKVVTEVKARLSSLVALMKDSENHRNWVYANKEAHVIEEYSNFHWIFYGYSDAPWPVLDRDMVVEVHLSQDENTKAVRNESQCRPDFIPTNDGVVRIQNCHSLWLLEPLADGLVRITFGISVDLAGSIPAWLMNLVIAKGPCRTVKNMTNEVEKPKYRDAVIDYIRD